MLIVELFKSKSSMDILTDESDLFCVQSKIGKRYITVYLESNYDDPKKWSIEFKESDTEGMGRDTHELTGSGDAPQVFSFVIDVIKLLISKKKPTVIEFSADKTDGNGNRAKLYERMLKRINVSGWSWRKVASDLNPDKYEAFELYKD